MQGPHLSDGTGKSEAAELKLCFRKCKLGIIFSVGLKRLLFFLRR